MKRYWQKPEQTELVLLDGTVLTGDAGYMDEYDYIFIQYRHKDMTINGGENVYSSEVENALSLHPAVAESAEIGSPDDKWGELVQAIVILKF